ncbi:MAG: acyl--CoA ligase [Beijerinckiaceae bacterium]|nr:acyl--CoA ligase [Beijerinckiaceae bacterium]
MSSALPRLIAPWNGLTFPKLAETMARGKPDQIAFVDAPDTQSWLFRPARALTYSAFTSATRRFARQMTTLGLKRGDTALFHLPNSTDFAVAFVGALSAGIVPVPVSLALTADQVREAAVRVNAQLIVTVSRFGTLQPAMAMRDIAAQVFSIRAIASFGGACPDGVVDLDAWDKDELDEFDPSRILSGDETCLVTMEFHGDQPRALGRTQSQLIAESIALTSTAHIGPRAQILNTLMPGSAFGVIASVALPLLIRAQVHAHGLFSTRTLFQQLKAAPGMAIIAPAAIEAGLVGLCHQLEHPIGSALMLRRLEHGYVDTKGKRSLPGRVVDVTAIGEAGHYQIPRLSVGRHAPLPQNWRQPGTRVVEDDTLLLQAGISEHGTLSMRGFGVPHLHGSQPGSAVGNGITTPFFARHGDGQTFEPIDAMEVVAARNAA